jgi:general secretion pathway protein G
MDNLVLILSVIICLALIPGSFVVAHFVSKKWTKQSAGRVFLTIGLGIVFLASSVAAVLVVFSILGTSISSRPTVALRAKVDIQTIVVTLKLYEARAGFFPTTEQGLQALVTKPASAPIPANWEAGLYDVPLDPWGKPYHYIRPGKHNPDSFDVWSDGPDKRSGTEDDIGNWQW